MSVPVSTSVRPSSRAESASAVVEASHLRVHQDAGREHARLALEIAADHHDGADLGEDAAERGDHRGEQAEADLAQQQPERACAAEAERAHLELPVLGPSAPTAACVMPTTSGSAISSCASTIADGVYMSPSAAERAAAPEQQRDHETDHHRRQSHRGVHQRHGRAAAPEAPPSERDAERQPDRHGDRERAGRHRERAQRDLRQRRHGEIVHGAGALASGTKSGPSSGVAPKRAISSRDAAESR